MEILTEEIVDFSSSTCHVLIAPMTGLYGTRSSRAENFEVVNSNRRDSSESETMNENTVVYGDEERLLLTEGLHGADVDPYEIYDVLRDIRDPEFPSSLGDLKVITEDSVHVDDKTGRILITFTPTVPHCHLANIIGLSIRAKLNSYLSSNHKVDIKVALGSHADADAVNKQLNDKERVAGAMQNPYIVELVEECISSTEL